MANLKVSIVVRCKIDGKRSWVPANGKTDPPGGTYYLRYCEGSKPKFVKVGDSFADAELSQYQMERRLQAASIGAVIPEEAPAQHLHRCKDVLTTYLAYLRQTTKRNGRRYHPRSIREREATVQEFLTQVGRLHIEQITRTDLLRYKEFLYGKRRASDTVYNKLAVIVTWLRHNQVVPIKGLLQPTDWPIVRDTKAHPFRDTEIAAMMAKAREHQLLLRLARGTGMRKGELMHAEKSDLDPHKKSIQIKSKPKYGWETKTLAGVREIPLGDDLLRDLLKQPDGLLFPNTEGQPDIRLDRRFESVGKAAGVKPPADDRASWCHRWRDSYATSLMRSRKLGLWDIAHLLGHEDLSMLNIYSEYLLMESREARDAANSVDEYGTKPGPLLVRAAGTK